MLLNLKLRITIPSDQCILALFSFSCEVRGMISGKELTHQPREKRQKGRKILTFIFNLSHTRLNTNEITELIMSVIVMLPCLIMYNKETDP